MCCQSIGNVLIEGEKGSLPTRSSMGEALQSQDMSEVCRRCVGVKKSESVSKRRGGVCGVCDEEANGARKSKKKVKKEFVAGEKKKRGKSRRQWLEFYFFLAKGWAFL